MICLKNARISILAVAMLLLAAGRLPAQTSGTGESTNSAASQTPEPSTKVHLRWGSRPGVARYRLQLAQDRDFADIICDRVVSGNEYAMSDLPPGRYFWRVAALTRDALEFSSTGVIDVTALNQRSDKLPDAPAPRQSEKLNKVISGDGWRALIGEVSGPVAAHLRFQNTLDLVAVSSAGIVYALDADNGVSLWTTRLRTQPGSPLRVNAAAIAPLVVRSRTGVDNIIILFNGSVFALDGSTGRELWQVQLSAPASGGVALGSELFIVDNSLRKLFLFDGSAGRLIAQTELPARAFGAPVAFERGGERGVIIAFESGRVELRDLQGKLVRSGDAGSPTTTRPLIVDGPPRGGLVLLGTRSGLTALDAGDLRPLGRVALKDDAPKGWLAAADLDGDGLVEVIMVTNRGRIVAVNAADGKILWDEPGLADAQGVTLADVNGDRVLDALVAGNQVFAMALSGRDGSVIWKEDEPQVMAANHAASPPLRSLFVASHGSGVLLIGADPSRMGLRAIEFPKGMARPGPR